MKASADQMQRMQQLQGQLAAQAQTMRAQGQPGRAQAAARSSQTLANMQGAMQKGGPVDPGSVQTALSQADGLLATGGGASPMAGLMVGPLSPGASGSAADAAPSRELRVTIEDNRTVNVGTGADQQAVQRGLDMSNDELEQRLRRILRQDRRRNLGAR